MYKHVKFLFSCLGDLYGAIGSPVRLTRTVIVGKRKELVQRLLYVLTYFIRCSELQENQLTWSEMLGEGEQVLNGSKITTALEKGEVEESDYVVVTVKNEPALVPPILPPKSDGGKNNSISGWVHNPEGTCTMPDSSKEKKEAIGKVSQNSAIAVDGLTSTLHNGAADGRKRTVTDTGAGSYHFEEQSKLENLMDIRKNKNQTERKVEKQLSSRSSALPCPERSGHRSSQLEKVTFRIGSSASPESDFETQRREMEENLKAFRKNPEVVVHCASSSTDLTVDVSQNQKESCEAAFLPFSKPSICYAQIPPCEGKERMLNQHMETKGTEMNLGNTVSGEPLLSTGNIETVTLPSLKETRTLCSGNLESYSPDCVEVGSAVRKESPKVSAKDIPYGDAGRKTPFRVEGDIPRNESSDSALGASDEEGDCIPDEVHHDNVSKRLEEFAEVELPLPR